MAIVADKSGASPTDKPWGFYNRVVTDEPNAVTTPQYAGEIVLDTNNNCLWRAEGVGNTTWVALTQPN